VQSADAHGVHPSRASPQISQWTAEIDAIWTGVSSCWIAHAFIATGIVGTKAKLNAPVAASKLVDTTVAEKVSEQGSPQSHAARIIWTPVTAGSSVCIEISPTSPTTLVKSGKKRRQPWSFGKLRQYSDPCWKQLSAS
jgi:hypothetical protein